MTPEEVERIIEIEREAAYSLEVSLENISTIFNEQINRLTGQWIELIFNDNVSDKLIAIL